MNIGNEIKKTANWSHQISFLLFYPDPIFSLSDTVQQETFHTGQLPNSEHSPWFSLTSDVNCTYLHAEKIVPWPSSYRSSALDMWLLPILLLHLWLVLLASQGYWKPETHILDGIPSPPDLEKILIPISNCNMSVPWSHSPHSLASTYRLPPGKVCEFKYNFYSTRYLYILFHWYLVFHFIRFFD